MRIERFSDPALAEKLLKSIAEMAEQTGPFRIMEVCGTHTMEIGRLGLRPLLPNNIKLISGPGCPVCVTPGSVIDAAARLALRPGVTVLAFGDLIKTPGNETSLLQSMGRGGRVQIVTSPLQGNALAESNPAMRYVFIAVGFETTIPAVARSAVMAREKGRDNLFFLTAHRLVPPALNALIADPELKIDAFLLPGHVSAVIGEKAYQPLVDAGLPSAITGFEPLDILLGIHAITDMKARGETALKNMYPRAVKPSGNPMALALIDEVFQPEDAALRGIGPIPGGGFKLRKAFEGLDAAKVFNIKTDDDNMPAGCSCGNVLRGFITPDKCPLFEKQCSPDTPIGPCMVSSEGSCAAYYRFERR